MEAVIERLELVIDTLVQHEVDVVLNITCRTNTQLQHCQLSRYISILHVYPNTQNLKSGYIEFAPLEYYADAIHSAIVNPAS